MARTGQTGFTKLQNSLGITINPATEDTLSAIETLIGDSLSKYQTSDIDATTSDVYIGKIDKDGNWFIAKIDTTTITKRYVKGTSGYTTAWTNRATQSYGYFNDIF